jgi:undecaprenyl-diphosphatase
VAATICLWWVIVLVVWPRTQAWWRWLLAALAVAMPALVATSRMYRGMHHPMDIAGAVLLSALLLTLVYLVVRPNADLAAGGEPAVWPWWGRGKPAG